MKKLTLGLMVAAFVASSLLAFWMVSLTLEIRSAGRVLPVASNVFILFRHLFLVLPAVAVLTYVWIWYRRQEHSMKFGAAVTFAMLTFVLPALTSSYVLMIDQVKAAVGIP